MGDLSNPAWGNLSISCSESLQQLQNRAARIICRCDSSKDTFEILKWTDLETSRKLHKCMLVF